LVLRNKIAIFLLNFAIKCNREQTIERSASLTLRVLLAFFPFIVFLMSLLGFLELDSYAIFEGLYSVFPDEISVLVASFVYEISETRNAGILSTALFFSVYNTTNGFRAIIRATNSAYGVDEQRSPAAQVWLSFILMILFSAAIIIMLSLLIFGRQLWAFVFPDGSEMLYTNISYITALFSLFVFTAYIYKLACAKPLPLKHILPGAAVTVIAWAITSALFGFFTQNFTQLPAIYGSIAGVFLLVLWLNAVSIILLAGNEINALLHIFAEKKP